MKPLFREDTPLTIRLFWSGGAYVLAVYAALRVAMRVEHPTVVSVLLTSGIALVGFLTLGLAATSRRPRLPLQLTLTLAALAALIVLAGLPIPPRTSSIGSQVLLLVVLSLTVTILLSLRRHPGRAFVFAMLLAAVGAFTAVTALRLAATVSLPAAARYPVWQIAVVIASCLAAAWHSRVLRTSRMDKRLMTVV